MCAQVQEFPLHENAHSKEMVYNGVYHIHTSIIETQVMISIEIYPCPQQGYFCPWLLKPT
jgi:hypothetical protein